MVAAAAITLRIHPLQLVLGGSAAALDRTEWPLRAWEFAGQQLIERVAIQQVARQIPWLCRPGQGRDGR